MRCILKIVVGPGANDVIRAKSFGFSTAPRIDISLGASLSRDKKVEGRRAYGSQPQQARRPMKHGKRF